MTQLFTLVTRSNNGTFIDKVTVSTNLDFCRFILQTMVYANKNVTRAEVLEGNRDYIGDFRVKPLVKYFTDEERNLVRSE